MESLVCNEGLWWEVLPVLNMFNLILSSVHEAQLRIQLIGWLANMILRAVLLCDHRQPPSTDWWHFGLYSNPITGSQQSLVSCDPGHCWGFVQFPQPPAHTFTLSAAALCPPLTGLEAFGRAGEGASFCSAGTNRHSWPRPGTVLSPRACKGQ